MSLNNPTLRKVKNMLSVTELKERIKSFNETYSFIVEEKEGGKKTFETYSIQNVSTKISSNYIRVTSPLSYWVPPALKNWLQTNTKNQAQKKLETAGNFGSQIHEIIEHCRGDLSKLPTEFEHIEVENGINAFKDFWQSEQLEIIAQEQRVFSPKFGVAGTIDMIAVRGDELLVIDWKSGFYKPSYGWQLAMYGQCVEEHFGIKPKLMAVILDKRSGKCSKIAFEHNDYLLSCYLGILQAFSGENWKALQEFWPYSLNQLMKGK